MIILSMAMSTVWKQHWSFIFREDSSQSLTYNHLKNAMWKTLYDRVMDDCKTYKKRKHMDPQRDSGLDASERSYHLPKYTYC
jgi:hypothetical protein